MLFRKLTMPEWMVDALLNELNTADSPLFGTEGPSTTDQQTSSSSSSSSSAAAPLELFSRLLAIEEEFSGLPAASTADGHTLAGYRELVISLWSAYYRPPPLEEAAAAAASSTFSTPKQSQSRAEALVSRCAEASRAGGLGRETTMTVVNPAPNSVLFNGGGGANSTTTTKVTPLVAPTLSSHSLAVAKANTVALVERTFEQHLRPFRGAAAAHQDAPATPEYLKEVVNCLSKAIKQCRQFVRDEQVQARAVAALLPKLPEAMRAAFADRCERRIDERSLRHLKLFKNSAICYKCSATGHIAKHCPSRLEAIRAQLADLLGRVQALPPEEVNLHKLVGLLERADLLTQPVWREESLQALARERLLPKLSAGLRERFLARCAAGGKRVTIRELKGFLVYELKTHPYRAQQQPQQQPPSSFTFGYGGGGGRASEKATAEEQPSKQQPNCSKCGSKNHRTEQCADVRQILGVE
ncbi:hypothetical protein TYRP_007813 [Tyrophagus putrescentiae]|nr:hypothetical protein TYRP_007813 [Tyrophagus putrescentiae]